MNDGISTTGASDLAVAFPAEEGGGTALPFFVFGDLSSKKGADDGFKCGGGGPGGCLGGPTGMASGFLTQQTPPNLLGRKA